MRKSSLCGLMSLLFNVFFYGFPRYFIDSADFEYLDVPASYQPIGGSFSDVQIRHEFFDAHNSTFILRHHNLSLLALFKVMSLYLWMLMDFHFYGESFAVQSMGILRKVPQAIGLLHDCLRDVNQWKYRALSVSSWLVPPKTCDESQRSYGNANANANPMEHFHYESFRG